MKMPDLKTSVGRIAEISPQSVRARLFRSGRILSLNSIIPTVRIDAAIRSGIRICSRLMPDDLIAVISKSEVEPSERHERGDQHRHRDRQRQHPGQIEADQFEHDPDRKILVNDVVDDFGDIVDDQQKGDVKKAKKNGAICSLRM